MTLISSKLREAGIRLFTIRRTGGDMPINVVADSYTHSGGTFDFYKGTQIVYSISDSIVKQSDIHEGSL